MVNCAVIYYLGHIYYKIDKKIKFGQIRMWYNNQHRNPNIINPLNKTFYFFS